MGLSSISGRLLQLLKLFVLARLLSPSAFGVFGIALLTVSSLKWLSRTGVKSALVQKSEDDVDEYLNTAFSLKLIRGFTLAAVVFLSAPHVATFFNEPRVTDIIRTVAIAPLITGLHNPATMYLEKDLEFHKKFALNVSTGAVNVTVAITHALVFESVWAFVWGLLAGRLVGLVGSYLVYPYRPWPELNWDLMKDIVGYGKWITASGPLVFLLIQGDDAFVGWLLGSSALGLYRVAYRIGNAPGGEIAEVVRNVAFPTYSKLQENRVVLRNAYFKTVRLTMALVLPLTLGIVLVAHPFVKIFLGDEWLSVVPALRVLTVYSAFSAFGKINSSLLKAVGRPDVNTKIQLFNLILVASLIYPATDSMGFTGTALVLTLSITLAGTVQLLLTLREIDGRMSDFLSVNTPPFAASLGMAGAVLLVGHVIQPTTPSIEFLVSVGIGVVIYPLSILLIERHSRYELSGLLRDMVEDMK